MAVQIAVIDDWQDVARDVVDWSVLDSVGEVTFEHDYPADNATLAERLGKYQVICVMRERTRFDEDLLERLPNLKLLVTGGMRNAALDMQGGGQTGNPGLRHRQLQTRGAGTDLGADHGRHAQSA